MLDILAVLCDTVYEEEMIRANNHLQYRRFGSRKQNH